LTADEARDTIAKLGINDPGFPEQWHLVRDDQPQPPPVAPPQPDPLASGVGRGGEL